MSFFVQTTPSAAPKTKNVPIISIALAAAFVALAVAQLYSFEDFPDVIASLGLPGGRSFASLWAALLVVGEVLAIPFLLSMRLSPAMRIVSMVAGWLTLVVWITIGILINTTTNAITNTGVLGATVPTIPGWWMVCLFIALGVLAGWASWGMWPFSRNDT
jgi:hypothetical protein